MSSYQKMIKEKRYLKVHKTPFGDELWISPEGSKEEYFLTDTETSMEEINNWREPEDKLIKLL